MRYNQIQESIIKVPPEILNKVNMYVSSYLYFKIKQYLDRLDLFLPPNMNPEEKQKIIQDGKNTLAKLNSKYGAKNISAQTANNIINKSIDIPFDVETFFAELNYKGVNPGLISLLKNRLKLSLLIAQSQQGIAGSKEQSGNYSYLVTVIVGNLGPRPSFLETASDIMSTVYHELQHIVQAMAIKNISNNDKQLHRNDGYSNRDGDLSDYYTSGIEYTPQLGNVIDAVNIELEKSVLKDELNPNKNQAISDAIQKVAQQNHESRMFLTHLYRKKPELYKKAMSAIYKSASPLYDQYKENGIDYAFTELPPEELEANVDVMLSVYKMLYKKEKFKVQAFGDGLDSIQKLEIESVDYAEKTTWKITLSKNSVRSDGYYVDIYSPEEDYEENEKLNSKEVLNLFGIISETVWYDATDIIDDIEYITGQRKEVTKDSVLDIIKSLEKDANYSDVPFEITGENTFNAMGRSFSVNKAEDSQDKVDITMDNEKTFYVWSLKQFLVAFQMMIRFYSNYPEEVTQALDKDTMYVEVMASLRRL